jgi:hypothetical protein
MPFAAVVMCDVRTRVRIAPPALLTLGLMPAVPLRDLLLELTHPLVYRQDVEEASQAFERAGDIFTELAALAV